MIDVLLPAAKDGSVPHYWLSDEGDDEKLPSWLQLKFWSHRVIQKCVLSCSSRWRRFKNYRFTKHPFNLYFWVFSQNTFMYYLLRCHAFSFKNVFWRSGGCVSVTVVILPYGEPHKMPPLGKIRWRVRGSFLQMKVNLQFSPNKMLRKSSYWGKLIRDIIHGGWDSWFDYKFFPMYLLCTLVKLPIFLSLFSPR